jgi:hypothetical protein
MNFKSTVFFCFLASQQMVFAQEATEQPSSNIQKYTPSKLLEKGTWDIKWFNNLYTQTRSADENGKVSTVPRASFFNTSLEIFTGISTNKKFNLGLIVEARSNTFAGSSTGSVFSFKNQAGRARAGIGHIAPSIKIAPFSSLPNFSLQSSFFIPLFNKETDKNGFLAQKSFIWQNRFFYDHTFPGKKFQLFSELGTRLFMGPKSKKSDGSFNENGGFANNSIEIAPGAFLSYFPNQKFTLLVFAQHAQLVAISNGFSQNYTAVGAGTKYQLNQKLNAELLYSKFVRGTGSGLGQSFNIGLRYIFK